MKNTTKLIICIIIPLAVGAISGYATVTSISTWYATLNKPSFNPPNYIFGPVWTTLYLLMGISLYMVVRTTSNKDRRRATALFAVQLTLNFFWSFLFFTFHQTGLALINIGLLWLSIAGMIWAFYQVNKTAALLQIPYIMWVSFASVLNAAIWVLN